MKIYEVYWLQDMSCGSDYYVTKEQAIQARDNIVQLFESYFKEWEQIKYSQGSIRVKKDTKSIYLNVSIREIELDAPVSSYEKKLNKIEEFLTK